jgi:hypothetical protein
LNSNVPDTIYPYLTAAPTLRAETVTLDGGARWTYFVVTLPVTPNVKAASVEVDGLDRDGSYMHDEGTISPVDGIITMTTTKVRSPRPASYAAMITLYTGDDPTGDIKKPLTGYIYTAGTQYYQCIRWKDYHVVDTIATSIPIPTVVLQYHDRIPVKPAL